MYKYANVSLTSNDLVKLDDNYYKAKKIGSIENYSHHVVYLLTYDHHILINDQIFSVHNDNHLWGTIKTIPLRLLHLISRY